MLKNSRGTYTAGQITVPETDGSCPLVFIAHGFKGTMNSGGAGETFTEALTVRDCGR